MKLSMLAGALAIVAAFVSWWVHERGHGREGGTQHLTDNLSQATEMYQTDFGAYPPSAHGYGPTMGSSTLSAALKSCGPKKQQYFEFRTGDLDASGNVVSPIRPATEVLSYRNNRQNFPGNTGDANAHRKEKFDIWCPDRNSVQNGIDNWGD